MTNLGTTENIEQIYRKDRLGNNDNGQVSQLYWETKTAKMKKIEKGNWILRKKYTKGKSQTW